MDCSKCCAAVHVVGVIDGPECSKCGGHAVERPGNDTSVPQASSIALVCLLQRLQEMLHAGNAAVFPGLEEALQASLEDAGQRSKQRPAAAKDEVGVRGWGHFAFPRE